MKVKQAYRFALDPTPAQELALRSHAGAARFAWNWGRDSWANPEPGTPHGDQTGTATTTVAAA